MSDKMYILQPGQMLRNDSYRIIRVLGQGGFGITYLAEDVNLSREVAVKEFFPKDFCTRDSSTSHVRTGVRQNEELIDKLKAKFLKEARNLAALNYRGIIKVYDAFEENDTAYYVMEYIEGETLSDMVKRRGALPVDKALEYIRQVGESLEYIHEKHLNHLDVKPANIMVRRSDDQTVLIDFGLSKQYDKEGNQTSTTPTGISHGYAPAEQYNDGGVKEFSPRTDLYSLAATFYYLLTAKVPPKAFELIDEGLKFPASLPDYIVNAIAKAMSVSKSNRQESVRDFLRELNGQGERTELIHNTIYPDNGNYAPQQSLQIDSQQPKKWDWKKIAIIAIIVVAVIEIIWLIAASSNDSSDYEDEDSEYVEDNNSPAPSENDKRDFMSPDLSLFNLHGKVKSVTYTTVECFPAPYYKFNSPINFDQNGVCENISSVFAATVKYTSGKSISASQVNVERNSNGEITRLFSNGSAYCDYSLSWRDGRIASYDCSFNGATDRIYYQYNGMYVSEYHSDWLQNGTWNAFTGTFSNIVEDKMGNWIEFDMLVTHRRWDDGYESDAQWLASETKHVTRHITYWE